MIIDNLVDGVLELISDMLAQRLCQILHRFTDPLQLHLDIFDRLFNTRGGPLLEDRLVLNLRILKIRLQTVRLGARVVVQLVEVDQTAELVLKKHVNDANDHDPWRADIIFLDAAVLRVLVGGFDHEVAGLLLRLLRPAALSQVAISKQLLLLLPVDHDVEQGEARGVSGLAAYGGVFFGAAAGQVVVEAYIDLEVLEYLFLQRVTFLFAILGLVWLGGVA